MLAVVQFHSIWEGFTSSEREASFPVGIRKEDLSEKVAVTLSVKAECTCWRRHFLRRMDGRDAETHRGLARTQSLF